MFSDVVGHVRPAKDGRATRRVALRYAISGSQFLRFREELYLPGRIYGLVAAIVPVPDAIAKNIPLPKATEFHCALLGKVRRVQFVPSCEVIAILVPLATATNVPPPKVMQRQFAETGRVIEFQVLPSFDAAAMFVGP